MNVPETEENKAKHEDIKSEEVNIEEAVEKDEDKKEDEEEEIVPKGKKKTLLAIGTIVAIISTSGILGLVGASLFKTSDIGKGSKKTSNSSSYSAMNICQSEECRTAAEFFKAHVDLSADPCNNFFDYACGSWVKGDPEKANLNSWSTYNSVRSKVSTILKRLLTDPGESKSRAVNEAKGFYKTCIDMDIVNEREGIQRVMTEFGGFPMYMRAEYNKNIKWWQRLAMGITHFSMFDRENGFTMGLIYNMIIDPGYQIRIIKPQNYLFTTSSHYRSTKYKTFVHDKMCFFIENSCTPEESESIKQQVELLAEFQAKLSEIVSADEGDSPMVTTLKNFDDNFPDLHFYDFLRDVFKSSNSTVTDTTRLSVGPVAYLKNLAELIRNTNHEVIDNNIGVVILLNLVFYPQSPPSLKAYRFVQVEGDVEQGGRVTWCFEKVQYAFRFAVGRLFVDHHFDREETKTLQNVLRSMRKAYIKLVNEKDWLDAAEKQKAITKLEVLDVKVGYPRWIKNNALLDNYYSLKVLYSREAVIENFKRVFTLAIADELTKLDYPNYKDPIWSIPPHDVNAFNVYLRNMILFPLGQYFTDFYWPKTTKALSFSGAGFILAHEMGHTLDTKGILCDAYGNIVNWMVGPMSSRNYETRVDCLKNQYSAIVEPMTNKNLKGQKSIDENIADNAAIRVAYTAYTMNGPEDQRLPGLEQLDDKKLFFVGAAINWCSHYSPKGMEFAMLDEHTPDTYRAYMPSANYDAFAEAFNCPKGSIMNAENKCVLW